MTMRPNFAQGVRSAVLAALLLSVSGFPSRTGTVAWAIPVVVEPEVRTDDADQPAERGPAAVGPGAVAAKPVPETPEKLHERARQLIKANKPLDAAVAFHALLQAAPDRVAARREFATLLLQL